MLERTRSLLLFALYQMSLVAGILLLPVALVARRVGFTLPIHCAIDRLGSAYDRTRRA
jgi:hypothetical protein